MEPFSIAMLSTWFFGPLVVTVTLIAIFARNQLTTQNPAWILGTLLIATWVGLVAVFIYVQSHGGAVPATYAKKLLADTKTSLDAEWRARIQDKDHEISSLKSSISDKESKILELEKERDLKIAQLEKEMEKLKSGERIKEVLDENKRLVAAKTKAEADSAHLRSQVRSLQGQLDEFTKKTAWLSARLLDSTATFELNGTDLQTNVIQKHPVPRIEHILRARYPNSDRNSAFFTEKVYRVDSKQKPQWEVTGLAETLQRKSAQIDVISYKLAGGKRIPLERSDVVTVELQPPAVARFGGIFADRGRLTFRLPAGAGAIPVEAGEYEIVGKLAGVETDARVTVIDTQRVILEFR